MALLDISALVVDPDFAQPFVAYRRTGEWEKGVFVPEESIINHYGVILPATENDLEQLPEGERVTGIMCFYSREEIRETTDNLEEQGASDELLWRCIRYKVIAVAPYLDYGYTKAFAVRLGVKR